MNDADFIAAVTEEMADIAATGVRQKGDQFAIWFAHSALGETLEDAKDKYHIGGSNDNKLDIGILDEDHDVIIIGQCRFADDPLSRTFSTDLVEEAKSARDRLISIPDAGSTKRRFFAEKYNVQRENETPERVLAIGFGSFSDSARAYGRTNDIEIYDFQRLKDLYEVSHQVAEGSAPASLTLTVSHPEVIKRTSTDPEAKEWITVIDSREIHQAVKNYKHGLFAKNLRYKLTQASKTAIAKQVKETLLTKPDALLLFNNGLTFVSTAVDAIDGALVLSHPQIVNGCQTSWAIFEALDELAPADRDRRPKAELLIKIVETTAPAIFDQIAASTNRQNAITDRDLRANDTAQREIGASFDRLPQPVLYENKEGGAAALGPRRDRYIILTGGRGKQPMRSMNNTEAAQVYLAVLGLPYYSKQSKRLIFSDLYDPIFGVNLSASLRFGTLSSDARPDFDVAGGPDGFRDDVLFGFAVSQLADGIKGAYEARLDRYEELGRALAPLEKSAYRKLQTVCSYHKFWQYFISAAIAEIVRLWAKRHSVTEFDIRSIIIADDIDPFFMSARSRQAQFKPDANLDHALVNDEQDPSDRYPALAKWIRRVGKRLETLIEASAGDPNHWDETFRMQGFIDQRPSTYLDIRNWIRGEYNQGADHWSAAFPLT